MESRIEPSFSDGLAGAQELSHLQDKRRAMTSGVFITPEDIEWRSPSQVTQLLSDIPGLTLSSYRIRGRVVDPRTAVFGQRGCQYQTFVDGIRVNPVPRDMDSVVFINDVIPMADIAAIEVYACGNSAPPRFAALNGNCGVLVIWSRRPGRR